MMGLRKYIKVWWIVVISAAVILTSGFAFSEVPNVKLCYSCHEDDVKDSFDMLSVHPPFLQKKCDVCHVTASATEASAASPVKKEERAFSEKTKVKWIGSSPSHSKTHWISLASRDAGEILYVKAQDDAEVLLREMVPVPSINKIKKLEIEKDPPAISNIRVLHVKRELFLSARIGWETDEMATSGVSYGIGSLNKQSAAIENLTLSHVIDLTGLKAGETYQFKVISQDMFGNEAQSEVQTFSTAKPFSVPQNEGEDHRTGGDGLELKKEFFSKGGDLVIKFSANRPVSVFVGVEPERGGEKKKTPKAGDGNNKEQGSLDHYWLKDEIETNITICYTCHPQTKEGASHPVNVFPKPGMKIPPEYATLSDGRISCISCHGAHGTNYDYRLVRESSEALCRGCHSEGF